MAGIRVSSGKVVEGREVRGRIRSLNSLESHYKENEGDKC